MSSNPVPVMGTQKFATDLVGKFTHLFANFMTTDHAQTLIFNNNVVSLSRLTQQAGNDAAKLKPLLQKALTDFLSSHFDTVNVTVTISQAKDVGFEGHYDIQVHVGLQDNNETLSDSYLLRTVQGKLERMIRLHNYGDAT